jgi:hypothetical protein
MTLLARDAILGMFVAQARLLMLYPTLWAHPRLQHVFRVVLFAFGAHATNRLFHHPLNHVFPTQARHVMICAWYAETVRLLDQSICLDQRSHALPHGAVRTVVRVQVHRFLHRLTNEFLGGTPTSPLLRVAQQTRVLLTRRHDVVPF